jgi:hypothetical protein
MMRKLRVALGRLTDYMLENLSFTALVHCDYDIGRTLYQKNSFRSIQPFGATLPGGS